MDTTNLDAYGHDALPWSRAERQLDITIAKDVTHFLTTVRPDGRPHVAGIGALWIDGRSVLERDQVPLPEISRARDAFRYGDAHPAAKALAQQAQDVGLGHRPDDSLGSPSTGASGGTPA